MRSDPNKMTVLTVAEIHAKIKNWRKQIKLSNIKIMSEAEKVIRDKIAHYEATGNTNKIAIYQLKLDHTTQLINKIKSSVSKK